MISTKPGLNRYLRVTPGGLLRIDQAAIAAEAKLDGKYLLRTSDPHLSAEDVALGYKQLAAIENAWRDMKHVIDLRPVFHRLEDRIRAHVLLCWLALLLVRIVETRTGQTWHHLRPALQRLHVGTFTGPAGTYQQTTTPGTDVKAAFAALDVELHRRCSTSTPPPAPSRTPRRRPDQAQHPGHSDTPCHQPNTPSCRSTRPYGPYPAPQLRNAGRRAGR